MLYCARAGACRVPACNHDEERDMSLNELTLTELKQRLHNKDVRVNDVITDITRAIADDDKTEKPVGAYNELFTDELPERADAMQARIDKGEDAPLLGVPIALKDNIAYKGHALTCSSRILEGYVAPYNAHVTERLLDAGAVILGRVNMDEFAMGSSTETSATKTTRNPHDRDRIPGGSSGGAAAAVAAHHCVAALGSDTGGSIRQPAALCGVVGLKPTYGTVSRYGLVAFGSSLDQIGPITKSVTDAALIMNVIAGHDARESTSLAREYGNFTDGIDKGVKGMTLGLPKEYFIEGIDEDVKARVVDVTNRYKELGATVKEVSLPHTQYGVNVYYIVATAEASSNLSRFDGIRYGRRAERADDLQSLYERSREEGFGEEVKRRILLGTFVLSSGYYDAYYVKALKVRTLIKQDFENAFNEVDAIIAPTTPTTAFGIGEKMNDPIAMYLSDIFTITSNLAGVPAVSVPAGFDGKGLPIGFQVIGKQFDESTILRVARAYEASST